MRSLLTSVVAAFLFAGLVIAAETNLGRDLNAAKVYIGEKRYAAAAALLEQSIDATRDLTDPTVKKQARTALHFYLGVAYSGMRRNADAMLHLEEALRLSPNMRGIDASKYSPEFVALFNQARATIGQPDTFGSVYRNVSSAAIDPASENVDAAALQLLGTKDEKREWQAIVSSEDRTRFASEFWKRRDPTPATDANEFRDTFVRRVALANALFHSVDGDGALSDRGRVFVLLGEPAFVRRRALSGDDAVQPLSRGSLGIAVGTIEYWGYAGDQLPVTSKKQTVTFRFVTHQGIGEYVLQKDGIAMNALAAATEAARRN